MLVREPYQHTAAKEYLAPVLKYNAFTAVGHCADDTML
jgi:hypothetical protein